MTFKWLVYIVAGALVSCRGAVLEDREGCPSLLYFDLVNAGAFGAVDSVQVNAFRHPGDGLPVREATTVHSLESGPMYSRPGRSFLRLNPAQSRSARKRRSFPSISAGSM